MLKLYPVTLQDDHDFIMIDILNNFSKNLCYVIKYLTLGNVEGMARQHVYIVATAAKNLVGDW